MVPRQNGFHILAFPATRGNNVGRTFSLTLFNVVVENVIRNWMGMTVEDQRVVHDSLGETVGQCLGVFYEDNGMVRFRDSDWLHHAMNILVGLFRSYGLAAKVVKSCTMTWRMSWH